MAKHRRKEMSVLETDPFAGYHYDVSDEFFGLFLDRTMTYSCGYYARGEETLEEAQIAKVDLAFHKIGLKPGHRLLDIGCGWGYACRRAVEAYGATAVGLTLSKNQFEYARRHAEGLKGLEYRLEGWETYREPCDRIACVEAFEHFGAAKHAAFFTRCRELLPLGGLMLIQTITIGRPSKSFELLRFGYFLYKEIFHTGEPARPEDIVQHGRESSFELLEMESYRWQYPRTIDAWVSNLMRNKEQAIRLTSPERYDKFMYCLTTSAKYHRSGETNAYRFLFEAVQT